MPIAPIVLFVYNRPFHTRKTVESLKKSSLTDKSALFIYSDGAKFDSDRENVESVRKYIHRIDGFSEIHITENRYNKGLHDSIISGITEVIKINSRIIVLEDDLIFSKNFLLYMNDALDFYEDNFKVFSVSGYCYPYTIPKNYNFDGYFFQRTSSWGWGTWKRSWEKFDPEIKDYNNFIGDRKAVKKFNQGGDDLTRLLKYQMEGKISSWSIKFNYTAYLHDGLTLYPVKTKVKNIGSEGSGTHKDSCALINRQTIDRDDCQNHFLFPDRVKTEHVINKNFLLFIHKIANEDFFSKTKRRIKKLFRICLK